MKYKTTEEANFSYTFTFFKRFCLRSSKRACTCKVAQEQGEGLRKREEETAHEAGSLTPRTLRS